MKKTIKLAVVAALALGATSAFATNGDHMIGLSAESRALGGTGIALYSGNGGSGNGLTNPALLSKSISNTEFVFAGTLFKPDVKVSTTAGAVGSPGTGVSKESSQDFSAIPAISLSHRINNEVVVGFGMYGTAGMGVDWRGSNVSGIGTGTDLFNMRSALMLMQFAPSIAYGTKTFGVGASVIMQYGSLSMDFDTSSTNHVGNGVSDDFGYGYQVGAYFNPTEEITIGAVYKSAIDMVYKDQISKSGEAFGYVDGSTFGAFTDHLEQPAEYGVGLAYENDSFAATFEVKEIQWGSAKGYKDFGWKDQTVFGLGGKYKADGYWVGLGYNYGKNPIPNNTDTTNVGGGNQNGHTMNMFNYVLFPATVESTYTCGTGFDLSDITSITLAYTYAPEVSDTVAATTLAVGDVTTKHSQQALTIGAKFRF